MSQTAPDRPTDPDALVLAFCAAWQQLDVDEVMSFFADDAVLPQHPAGTGSRAPTRSAA